MTIFLGKSNVSKGVLNYKFYLQKLVDDLDLVDIWRLKHPQKKRFTRHEKTRYGLAQSRIDFFLISCHLEFATISTDILPSIKSDHSLLSLNLSVFKQQKGRGLWKMNVSLLQDTNYLCLTKQTILTAKITAKKLINKDLVWDFIKCKIRTDTKTTITYSISKHKEQNKILDVLSAKLEALENLVTSTPDLNSAEEYNQVKKN